MTVCTRALILISLFPHRTYLDYQMEADYVSKILMNAVFLNAVALVPAVLLASKVSNEVNHCHYNYLKEFGGNSNVLCLICLDALQ